MAAEESDLQLLNQYPWAAYSTLPPVMREGIEVILLKEILLTQAGSETPAIQIGTAMEFSQQLLRSDKLFRSLFLTCWKLGSFDAVRESDNYQSFKERHSPKILGYYETPNSVGAAIANGDIRESPRGVYSALRDGQVVNINGGMFNDVAGDSWTINYSVDQYREVMDWYSTTDYQRTHQDVSKKRAENTGGWFTESEEYLLWYGSADVRVLWCPGIPGVGKTVLASTAINHLQANSNPRDVTLFIYFNYTTQKELDQAMILRILSRQMYGSSIDSKIYGAASLFEGLYNSHKAKKTQPTQDEIRDTLAASFREFERISVVLDALDEYLEHFSDAKIQAMLDAILSLNENVKLLVTSRILGEMENTFKDLQAVRREIHVHDIDVDNYLRGRVTAQEFCFPLSPSLTDLIVEEVKSAAKGRFLMAELHMNSLIEYSSPGDVKDALKVLPEEVDQTYSYVMDRISRHSERRKDLAMQTLMWIACANRPLTLPELQHALATRQGRSNIDDYLTGSSIITGACAGLVVLQNEQNVVSFVHYTAREFFDRQEDKYFPNRKYTIVKTCLNYLSRSCFQSVSSDPIYWEMAHRHDVIKNLQEGHAFYDYAALQWGVHAEENNDATAEVILSFLRGNHNELDLSLRYALYKGLKLWSDAPGVEGAGIFLAIYHKQVHALTTLMAERLPGSKPLLTRSGLSPLMLASRTGLLEAVKFLVDGHPVSSKPEEIPASQQILSEVNAVDKDGWTALSWAVWTNSCSALEFLLQHPAVDVNCRDNKGDSPLLLAVKFGKLRLKVCNILVNHEATDPNCQDNDGVTALSHAASGGFVDAVKSLLTRQDVDVNLPCNRGRSPLSWACLRGDSDIVSALLDREDVDVHLRDKERCTPLSLAAQHGHTDVILLLQQRGAVDAVIHPLLARPNVDDRARLGVITMLIKYVHNETTTLEVFLQSINFDLDYANEDGLCAIAHAVIQKNTTALEFLLKRPEVNPNRPDNMGRPPLYWAIKCENSTPAARASAVSLAKLFLEREDFDPNIKDHAGGSLMFYADKHLYHETLHILGPRSDELLSKKKEQKRIDKGDGEAVEDQVSGSRKRPTRKSYKVSFSAETVVPSSLLANDVRLHSLRDLEIVPPAPSTANATWIVPDKDAQQGLDSS